MKYARSPSEGLRRTSSHRAIQPVIRPLALGAASGGTAGPGDNQHDFLSTYLSTGQKRPETGLFEVRLVPLSQRQVLVFVQCRNRPFGIQSQKCPFLQQCSVFVVQNTRFFCGTNHTLGLPTRNRPHFRHNLPDPPHRPPDSATARGSQSSGPTYHRKTLHRLTASKKRPLRPHKPIHSPPFTIFPTPSTQGTPDTNTFPSLCPIFPVWRARYRNFICTLRMHMKSLRFFSLLLSSIAE